ncbi:MAG: DUF6891 domain-containing protein [Marmoricola sp.]
MRLRRADRRATHEAQTRAWLRAVVRSGLFDAARVERELRSVIGADLPHLDPEVAPAWIAAEWSAWAADAEGWPAVTDHERLLRAFARLAAEGLPVLVGCEDHWAATAALADLPADAHGLIWFTPMDVWHAVDEPMLEVNVWDRAGVNQREGAPLVERAIDAFGAEGIAAHFDEGRLEVAARWQRFPHSPA